MVSELITKNNKLITNKEWIEQIQKLEKETNPKDIITDEKKAINLIKKSILNSIKKRLEQFKDGTPFAILLSGGVDSSLITHLCHKFKTEKPEYQKLNFTCITIGYKDNNLQKIPDDIISARKLIKLYNIEHKEKILNITQIEPIFQKVIKYLEDEKITKLNPKNNNLFNIVNLGVGSVELAGIKIAKELKIKHIFGGLGSEEIFGGYKRHEDSTNINQECWNGLKNMYARDLLRDIALSINENITFHTPLLDKELIKTSMTISEKLKIKDNIKKYILRKVAKELELKKEFAFRTKKAAQYGSRISTAIKQISKKYKFNLQQEYINNLKIKNTTNKLQKNR